MKEEFSFSNKKNDHSPSPKISRRLFLAKAAALTAAGLLASNESTELYKERIRRKKGLEEVNNLTEYETGQLEGKFFSADALFSFYTGIKGQVREKVAINFRNQLVFLGVKKSKWVEAKQKSNPEYLELNSALLKEYETETPLRMDLKSYQTIVDSVINEVQENLDWKKVEGIFYESEKTQLSEERMKVLKSITDSLDSRHLSAYAFTELMPSSNGELNRDVFEFLLKNAGLRFLSSIPSIYDEYACVGMYQITKIPMEDISKMNNALPEEMRIQTDVSLLRGKDHHQAALLLAIYNLAALIRQLDEKQFQALKESWRKNMIGITQFIALAHHAPTYARFCAREWFDDDMKDSFEESCPLEFQKKDAKNRRQYAVNTKMNLAALK